MKPLRAINVMFVMKMIVYCKVIVFIVPVAYCNDRIRIQSEGVFEN